MRRSPRSEEPQRRLKRPAGGFSQHQCALIQQTASNKAGLSRRHALSAPGRGGFVEQRQSRIAILWRQPMEVDARVKAALAYEVELGCEVSGLPVRHGYLSRPKRHIRPIVSTSGLNRSSFQPRSSASNVNPSSRAPARKSRRPQWLSRRSPSPDAVARRRPRSTR